MTARWIDSLQRRERRRRSRVLVNCPFKHKTSERRTKIHANCKNLRIEGELLGKHGEGARLQTTVAAGRADTHTPLTRLRLLHLRS